MNVITITLTVAIGSTMGVDTFLTTDTLLIVFLGLVAFVFGTAISGGIMLALLGVG